MAFAMGIWKDSAEESTGKVEQIQHVPKPPHNLAEIVYSGFRRGFCRELIRVSKHVSLSKHMGFRPNNGVVWLL